MNHPCYFLLLALITPVHDIFPCIVAANYFCHALDMTKHAQSSFTLLEVLISMAIISVVILALIKTETDNLTQSYQNFLQTLAIIQAHNLLEQLHAHHQASLNTWNKENKILLPSGNGNYSCHLLHCTVTLKWHIKKDYILKLDGA